MKKTTKAKLLLGIGLVCGGLSILFFSLSFILIKDGAYPPEGTGSLGHVGMVIAGIISGILTLIFGAVAAYCLKKSRTIMRSEN